MADVITAPDGPAAGVNYVAADTELKAGALGFWGGMVQAVTHIAPGLNVLLGLTFIVSFAAVAAPIAYIIGGIICLGVAVVLTQLAKQFTGAGGYFLYVSSTIGPRTGWITTWLYFLYDPIAVSSVCAFAGLLVEQTLQQQYGIHISWYFWFFAFLAIVTGFTLFGISLSAKAMLVLGGFEVSIFLLLAIFGLISPGHGGFNFQSFNPNNLPSAKGLYLGVVFTILALSGFEAVAPLAEETENPKRNLPIVIVVSTIGVAIFYAFVNWGVLVGHGTTSVAAGNFTQSDQIFDLARRLWSGAWILVLIATVNSALAVSIAIQNASTRVFFGMGRIGALPRWLGYAHPAVEDAVERDHRDDGPDGRDRDGARLDDRPDESVRNDRHRPDAGADRRLLDGQPRRGLVLLPQATGRVQLGSARCDPDPHLRRAGLGRLEDGPGAAHLRAPDAA